RSDHDAQPRGRHLARENRARARANAARPAALGEPLRLEIFPVDGIPDIAPGDDIASLVADRSSIRDGDVAVVTSKIVSKAEGRLVEVDPTRREADRRAWAERESRRIVARRGELLIAETAHGLVCANAGVDGSNLPPD